jgi:hypothetical protein
LRWNQRIVSASKNHIRYFPAAHIESIPIAWPYDVELFQEREICDCDPTPEGISSLAYSEINERARTCDRIVKLSLAFKRIGLWANAYVLLFSMITRALWIQWLTFWCFSKVSHPIRMIQVMVMEITAPGGQFSDLWIKQIALENNHHLLELLMQIEVSISQKGATKELRSWV